ncbi:MAG: hypothetical protein HC862_29345, partial [Scytonema sp. RU_4_4]|nr:hypothetical protein [Scytonema sp. RU_4_4]
MNISSQFTIPIVVQPSDKGDRAFDIYSRLLAESNCFLKSEVTDETANLDKLHSYYFLMLMTQRRD